MRYSAEFLIKKRKEKWNANQDLEYDNKFRNAVANQLLIDNNLLNELKEYPENLIELFFLVVNKEQKTVPFFLNEVQLDFINKLNKAVDEFNNGKIREIAF